MRKFGSNILGRCPSNGITYIDKEVQEGRRELWQYLGGDSASHLDVSHDTVGPEGECNTFLQEQGMTGGEMRFGLSVG